MIYGVKISKKGYDAQDADAKNLVFDSAFNHLKTAGSGTVTKTVNASSTATETVSHSLEINPLVLAYFRNTANSNWFITVAQPELTSSRHYTNVNVEVYVTTSAINFRVINNSLSQVEVEIKYEYFYEGDA